MDLDLLYSAVHHHPPPPPQKPGIQLSSNFHSRLTWPRLDDLDCDKVESNSSLTCNLLWFPPDRSRIEIIFSGDDTMKWFILAVQIRYWNNKSGQIRFYCSVSQVRTIWTHLHKVTKKTNKYKNTISYSWEIYWLLCLS